MAKKLSPAKHPEHSVDPVPLSTPDAAQAVQQQAQPEAQLELARKARAKAALRRGEFNLADQLLARENIELDSLVENLRIYQAELEIQNAELREAQALSEQALDRFAQLFSHLPLAQLVIDRVGQIQQANQKALALFCMSDSGSHMSYLRRLIESDDEVAFGRALMEASKTGASQIERMHFIAMNGSRFIGELHIARLPMDAGRDLQFICAVVDLSERMRAESRIAALAAVVENSHDIIVVKDRDLRVLATNMAFAQASGHDSVGELIGKTDAEIFNMSPDQEPVRSYMADDRLAQTLPPGEFILREEPVCIPGGEVRQVMTRKYPIHDANGVLLGSGNISVDISPRKRAEELERFSAFQAGVAEMSTSVLHNVGNAITAMIQDAGQIDHAGSEMLRVAGLLEANAEHAADTTDLLAKRQFTIQREAARAIRQLIEDSLRQPSRRIGESVRHIADMVRIQQSAVMPSAQRVRFSLTQAIHSAMEMQGAAFEKLGIRVNMKVDPAVEIIGLSQNLMLQTLVNVLRNSIEAIEERRRDETFAARIDIHAEALADERLRLSVSDNGCGFEPSLRENLFRFGFSSKPRGTGFGLPSVAVFASEAGGLVLLDSDGPGLGARLVLELPLQQGSSGPEQATP